MSAIAVASETGRWRRPRRTRRRTAATAGASTYAKKTDSSSSTPPPSIALNVMRAVILTKRDRLGIPTRTDRSQPLALSTAIGVAGRRPHRGRRRSRTDDADSRLSPGDLPYGGAGACRRPRVVVPGPARDSAAGPVAGDAID